MSGVEARRPPDHALVPPASGAPALHLVHGQPGLLGELLPPLEGGEVRAGEGSQQQVHLPLRVELGAGDAELAPPSLEPRLHLLLREPRVGGEPGESGRGGVRGLLELFEESRVLVHGLVVVAVLGCGEGGENKIVIFLKKIFRKSVVSVFDLLQNEYKHNWKNSS